MSGSRWRAPSELDGKKGPGAKARPMLAALAFLSSPSRGGLSTGVSLRSRPVASAASRREGRIVIAAGRSSFVHIVIAAGRSSFVHIVIAAKRLFDGLLRSQHDDRWLSLPLGARFNRVLTVFSSIIRPVIIWSTTKMAKPKTWLVMGKKTKNGFREVHIIIAGKPTGSFEAPAMYTLRQCWNEYYIVSRRALRLANATPSEPPMTFVKPRSPVDDLKAHLAATKAAKAEKTKLDDITSRVLKAVQNKKIAAGSASA